MLSATITCKMENCRLPTIIVYSVLIILIAIIHSGDSATVPNKDDLFTINVTMANFDITQEDEYAFVQHKLPDEELTIVGYSPLTDMKVAHHMLTYACEGPGSDQPSWIQGGTCRGAQMIIHGWARNAPSLTLPEDVGFAVGRNTRYKYIVVNIHYLSVGKGDNSGNQLLLSRKPRKYRAGVMLGGTGAIYLPPKTQTIRTPFSCYYNGPPVSIFAVRVHAHQWARVNSLYRVRDGKISQIVKSNPQWAQSFYPLPSPVQIHSGDTLVGQCVYDNNDDRAINVGSTHHDEMCNVYAMYSYEPAQTSNDEPPMGGCWADAVSDMSRLLPPDSLIAPASPADIGGTNQDDKVHASHTMELSAANTYTYIESWPDVKTLPNELGQVGGIALNNANDELVVFHRGSRKWEAQYFDGVRFRHEVYGAIVEDTLIHIDTHTGQTKSRWGAKMFYMPHGLTIDQQGNFWLTDIAMHQVFMFKANNLTHPALTVGERFVPGSGKNQFCRPADIAVMKNGDFFVADGYCNSRIIRFNQQGQFVMEWGVPMTGQRDSNGYPPPQEWNIVHSIALNEDAQLVCGADRENSRIQCFHPNTGTFLRQIHVKDEGRSGAVYAIAFASTKNGVYLFAVSGGPQTLNKKVYMFDAQSGDMLTSFGTNSHLTAPHDITVSTNAREIYVGELATSAADALQKFQSSENKAVPQQPMIKKISFKPEQIRVFLIVLLVCIILLMILLTICFIIRLRKICALQHSTSYTVDANSGGGSVLSNWMNRQKGFERIEQDAEEEEDQLLHSDEDHQPASVMTGDGTVTIRSRQEKTAVNHKNNIRSAKISGSL